MGRLKHRGAGLGPFPWGRGSTWGGPAGAGRGGPLIWGVSLISSQMLLGRQTFASAGGVSR